MHTNVNEYLQSPYHKCIPCQYLGTSCDGPNFLSMTTDQWCDWCRMRKDYLGWTNAQIAEKAEISKISVDRVMSGQVKDLRLSTMQAITKALVNGSWGQYPCTIDEIEMFHEWKERAEAAEKDLEQIREELESVESGQDEEIDRIISDGRRRIEFLKEQLRIAQKTSRGRMQAVIVLAILFGCTLFTLIFALIIDKYYPDIGFFWRST